MKIVISFILILFCIPVISATNPVSKKEVSVVKKVNKTSAVKKVDNIKNINPQKIKKKSFFNRFLNRNKKLKRDLSQFDDIFDDKVYKELDFKIILSNTDKYIGSIKSLCNNKKNKKENLIVVRRNLGKLSNYSESVINNYRLRDIDRRYLLNIRNQINPNRVHYKKKSSTCEGIRDEFRHSYTYYNQIQDNIPLKDYPHQWAVDLIKGLNCSCN